MKKYILIWMITVTACLVFADGKKELKFIVDNVDSKVFQEAEVRIDKLQGQAEKYSSQGKYDKALEYYHKSLVEAKRLYGENSTAAASIYTGMALPYIKMDKKLKAADSLFTASQIYKKSGGGMLRPRASRFLLMHAGYLYYDSNYTRKACKILEQAEQQDIPMFSSAEKEKRLAEFYRYLALACFKEEKYKEAIPYFQKSLLLEYKRTEPDNKELGVINLFIGNALLETNKLKESLLYLQKAEKSFESCKINANYQYRANFKSI
ncbi:MAG: tetratricopeptide repeat protein [Victivallales bacterium]|nr:tetratricopeptide repeat protein [Victivallales bacterium]